MMYGEILDPNLPLLGCKTFRGLAFRTGPLDRRTSRYAAALQQIWPVPLGPWGPELLHSLIGIRLRATCSTHAGLLPWLRLRTVFRHPCLQTRGRGIVAAKWDALERFLTVRIFKLRFFTLCASIAAASSPPLVLRLRGLGLARFGSLGLITLGCAIGLRRKRFLLFTAN